jgi:hypothetical protein
MQRLVNVFSGQWMPQQREDNGQRSQKRADGRKHDTDFRGLVFGDQVGGQILEHILKIARARSRVISSAGHICNLLQRRFINPSAESAELPATAASTKLPTASARLTTELPAATRPAAKRLVAYKLLAAWWKV